eukprot:CAMPEP_0203664244 /NCGR_PEP_ID=MMETSP0090-20130426/1695_1 /ASSEMBLY_ACC=CAM_ASM_001088 /TAXON_ID=426623 /ORGANISM="Chaetoceros affinis, Strain CCMP159" /LENGTH=186 /DNA_ID=CAMNT_0050527421 /DNA_START=708 /DNA_END=1267 /DNA_ORIENTATION=+
MKMKKIKPQHEDEDEEEHLEDTRIIYRKVVKGDGKFQSHKTDASFRSKHPKSDIVLDEPNESKEDSNSANCDIQNQEPSQQTTKNGQQISHGEMLFPITMPAEIDDAKVNKEELLTWDRENAEDMSNSIIDVSDSIQICNICLEEYKVGEDIGWSRNSECHHAFHKDCIIEWLTNNDDCPICRKKY